MHNNAQKLSERLGAKFFATTRDTSIVKIARLDDTFLEVFELQASPVKGQSRKPNEKKTRKRKGEKRIKKIENSQNFDFCARPSQNVAKRDASGKKSNLSCCKCLF